MLIITSAMALCARRVKKKMARAMPFCPPARYSAMNFPVVAGMPSDASPPAVFDSQ